MTKCLLGHKIFAVNVNCSLYVEYLSLGVVHIVHFTLSKHGVSSEPVQQVLKWCYITYVLIWWKWCENSSQSMLSAMQHCRQTHGHLQKLLDECRLFFQLSSANQYQVYLPESFTYQPIYTVNCCTDLLVIFSLSLTHSFSPDGRTAVCCSFSLFPRNQLFIGFRC